MTDQDVMDSEEYGAEQQREILSTLSLLKRVLYSLVALVLVLSVSFNLYLAFHNRRLNEALDFYTGRVQQMSMRDQTLDRLFRDLSSLAEDNLELGKLLHKYNIRPNQGGASGEMDRN